MKGKIPWAWRDVEAPEGMRLLAVGESIEHGDLVRLPPGMEWRQTAKAGDVVQEDRHGCTHYATARILPRKCRTLATVMVPGPAGAGVGAG